MKRTISTKKTLSPKDRVRISNLISAIQDKISRIDLDFTDRRPEDLLADIEVDELTIGLDELDAARDDLDDLRIDLEDRVNDLREIIADLTKVEAELKMLPDLIVLSGLDDDYPVTVNPDGSLQVGCVKVTREQFNKISDLMKRKPSTKRTSKR